MSELIIPNLFARRSIRQYTGEPISKEQIETLLQAAMSAPSAGNRKPWHFVVVTEDEGRTALADGHPYAQMLRQAAVCIVPCAEPSLAFADVPTFWVQDLAAATENILLAGTALGLGTCWCGVHPVEERVRLVREALGLPEDIIPFALIAVGQPAETKEPRTQYDAARVRRERW